MTQRKWHTSAVAALCLFAWLGGDALAAAPPGRRETNGHFHRSTHRQTGRRRCGHRLRGLRTDRRGSLHPRRGRPDRPSLAAGLLGKDTPAPLKPNALAQSLTWDGKDDDGQWSSAKGRTKSTWRSASPPSMPARLRLGGETERVDERHRTGRRAGRAPARPQRALEPRVVRQTSVHVFRRDAHTRRPSSRSRRNLPRTDRGLTRSATTPAGPSPPSTAHRHGLLRHRGPGAADGDHARRNIHLMASAPRTTTTASRATALCEPRTGPGASRYKDIRRPGDPRRTRGRNIYLAPLRRQVSLRHPASSAERGRVHEPPESTRRLSRRSPRPEEEPRPFSATRPNPATMRPI